MARLVALETDLGPRDEPPPHLLEVFVHLGPVLEPELALLVTQVEGLEGVFESVLRFGGKDPEQAFGCFFGRRLGQHLDGHSEQHEDARPVVPAVAAVLGEVRIGEPHPRQVQVEGLVLGSGRVRVPPHPEEAPEGLAVAVGHRLDGSAALFLGHQEGLEPAEFGDAGPVAPLAESSRRDGQQQGGKQDSRHDGNLARGEAGEPRADLRDGCASTPQWKCDIMMFTI